MPRNLSKLALSLTLTTRSKEGLYRGIEISVKIPFLDLISVDKFVSGDDIGCVPGSRSDRSDRSCNYSYIPSLLSCQCCITINHSMQPEMTLSP